MRTMEKYIAITALIILGLLSPVKIYAQSARKAAEYTREASYYLRLAAQSMR